MAAGAADDGSDDIIIMVDEQGGLQMVYSDELVGLFAEDADLSTARASHVEPHPLGGGWVADMSPVGGPLLGADGEYAGGGSSTLWAGVRPFTTRAEALGAEVSWLRREMARRTLHAR